LRIKELKENEMKANFINAVELEDSELSFEDDSLCSGN